MAETKPKLEKVEGRFEVIYRKRVRRGAKEKLPVIQIVVDFEAVVINLCDKPVKNEAFNYLENNTLPIATQEELKMLYDYAPTSRALVKPPKDYKAPWEKSK